LATVRCTHGTADQQAEYTGILTEEFERLLRQDDTADYHIQISQYEMVLYGIGPLLFPDEYDWHHESALCKDLLVPDMSRSDPTQWDECAVLKDFLPHELRVHPERDSGDESAVGTSKRSNRRSSCASSESKDRIGPGNGTSNALRTTRLPTMRSQIIPCAHHLFRDFLNPEKDGKDPHTIVPISSATETSRKVRLLPATTQASVQVLVGVRSSDVLRQ
jgi:hypothetical protein